MEIKDTYTMGEFQTMDNNAINGLAAHLRGFRLVGFSYFHDDGEFETRVCQVADFIPTIRHDQSRELLDWAVREHEMDFMIRLREFWPRVVYFGDDLITIQGNDARAETIAFCAAMLVKAGRLK